MFLPAVVPAAFFTSGAAGLIFQLIWFYRCGLVLGSSVASATAVLSAFMSGLALGNALTSKYAPRLTDYLRAYVVLELIVAASGILVSLLLPRLALVIGPLSSALSSPSGANTTRFVLAFALMVLPASAMGATLPVLVAALRERSGSAGSGRLGVSLGSLYGWNTLGAVTGVLVSEFVLVSRIGISGSAIVAATLNLIAALLVARLRSISGQTHRIARERANNNRAGGDAGHEAGQRKRQTGDGSPGRVLIFLATALAGAALLALEVMWFRFLSMYVLVTTAAMSLMLAVVLAGIAAGGLLAASWLARRGVASHERPHSMRAVASLACVAGALAASGYGLFQTVTAGTQVESLSRVLWFALVLTFPVSLCSGALFTVLGDALSEMDGDTSTLTARETSRFVLANTAGAMLGPPLAGYLLLPFLGLERGLFVLAAGYGVIAAVVLAAGRYGAQRQSMGPAQSDISNGRDSRRVKPGHAAAEAGDAAAPGSHAGRATLASRHNAVLPALSAMALIAALTTFPFGAMATSYFPRAAAAYNADGSTIVASKEGPSETVFVMQQRWLGQPVYSRLVTNGFSMSGTALQGQRYMRAFAYYPMLLHEGPIDNALVICYGVGVTLSAVTHDPAVKKIDVAEISRDVVAMSDVIYPAGSRPIEDPRVQLHIEDGRFLLQTTRERYDVITGEPPPPRTPGTANIYSEEFFRLVYSRLRERGIATYWVPVARPNPGTDVNTIIKAFCTVFTDCTLWNATPFDLMLMGSRNGSTTPRSLAQMTSPWQTPGLEARLREVGFERAEQIGATFIGDATYLQTLTKDAPPLTDDFPQRLNPVPGRPSLSDPAYGRDAAVTRMYEQVLDVSRAASAFESSPWIRAVWPPELIERTRPYFRQQAMLNRVYWEGGRPLRQIDDLDAVLSTTSLRTLPLWMLGSDEVKQRIAEVQTAGSTNDTEPGSREYARGLRALSGRDFAGAVQWLVAAEQRDFASAAAVPLRAYALYKLGRADEARAVAASAQPADDDAARFWTWLRRALQNATN